MKIFMLNPELNTMFEDNIHFKNTKIVNNVDCSLKNKSLNDRHIILDDIFNKQISQESFDKIETLLENNKKVVNCFNFFFYYWCWFIDIVSVVTLFFCIILAIYINLNNILTKKLKNYFYFIGVVIYNCLSYYEILSVLSCSLLLIIYSLTNSFVEDDSYDFTLLLILSFIFLLIFLYFKINGLFKSYYLLTSNSSGERLKRLFLNDMINIFLCLLRIVLCWTRFIFYDLQVEFVDMTTNYTEEVNLNIDNNFFDIIINKIFDLFLILLSLIICLVKFGISLFLLWLIVDLFILRIGSQVDEVWLFKSLLEIVKIEINKNKNIIYKKKLY